MVRQLARDVDMSEEAELQRLEGSARGEAACETLGSSPPAGGGRGGARAHDRSAAPELELQGNPRIGRNGYAALAAALGDARVAPKLQRIYVDYPKAASATELRAACEARGIELKNPVE